MKNFKRGGGGFGGKSGSFGRGDSGGRGFNRRDDRSDRPMHRATCAECGQSCEVPFRPTGDKPVFCSSCFKGKDGSSSRRSDGGDFSRPSFGDKKLFKAICADCGKNCEVPFKPSGDKPVYCSECFGKGGGAKGDNSSKEQFAILNEKLDKILRALSLSSSSESVIKKEISKEVKASEPKKIVKKVEKKSVALKTKVKKKEKKK